MSARDKVRSFSESREPDETPSPAGALTYGDLRELATLLERSPSRQSLELSNAIREDAKTVRDAYLRGLREGVSRFAWWKDGEQYVGACGTTLQQAMMEIDEGERRR